MSPLVRRLAPDVVGEVPLICVHPASGETSCYAPLTPYIRRGVLGLASPWVTSGLPVPDRIEDIAALYLDALPAEAAPLLLLGWSTGGLIAYAMAQLARARGIAIAGLALVEVRAPQAQMVDTPPTEDATAMATIVPLVRRLLQIREATAGPTAEQLAQMSTDERLEVVRVQTIRAGLLAVGSTSTDALRFVESFHGLGRAYFAYRPAPYAGRLTLFEATSSLPEHPRPATLGWERYAARVESIPVQGNLFNMLGAARAPTVGRQIDDWATSCTRAPAE